MKRILTAIMLVFLLWAPQSHATTLTYTTAEVETLLGYVNGSTAFGRGLWDLADEAAFKALVNLEIGTDVQAYDADLTTYAGITPAANIQSLLGAADYAAAVDLMSLTIGTDVQAYDADLTTYAGITPAANVQSMLAAADYAAMRALLDLETGTDVLAFSALDDTKGNGDTSYIWSADKVYDQLALKQVLDSDLTIYAGITPTANAQALLIKTYAQMQASLSVDDLITLSGVSEGAANLGTFTGSTITDDSATVKSAFQEVETAIEGLGGGHDAVTLSADADAILELSTQAIGVDDQDANLVLAGPVAGGADAPAFRSLVAADIPDISATYEPVDATIVREADVDDTPVDGVTAAPVSSNWAYDHAAAADSHAGYMLESNLGSGANNYIKLAAVPGSPDGNKYLRDDLTWVTPAAGGDVTGVGDCATGACLDGTDDGGETFALYDGDSNKATFAIPDLSGDVIYTFPAATSTMLATNGSGASLSSVPLDSDFSSNGLMKRTAAGTYGIGVDGTDFLAPTRIDDTKTDGDTTYVWSADKVYDELQTKQPLDADLSTWGGISPAANMQSLAAAADYAAMRTLLDLEAGTDFYSVSAADTAFLENTQLDDTKGNGDTTFIYSADKVFDLLALKAPLASPTFTGTVTVPTPFTIGAVSTTATGTEINYLVGLSELLTTSLDARALESIVGTSLNALDLVNTGGVLETVSTIPHTNTNEAISGHWIERYDSKYPWTAAPTASLLRKGDTIKVSVADYDPVGHGGSVNYETTITENSTELMPNTVDRDFSGASAWEDVDLVAGSGAYGETTDLTITAGAAGAGDYCTLAALSAPTTSGSYYAIHFDAANLVGTWTVKDFDGTNTIGTISAEGTGQYIIFVADDSNGGLRLVAVSNLASGDFDNFSLTKLSWKIGRDDAGNTYESEKQLDGAADSMADDNFNGITLGGKVAGSGVSQWNPVFLAADGKFDEADADNALFPALGLAVTCSDATWDCDADDGLTILLQGVVRNEGWTGLTVGGAVYLHDNPADATGMPTGVNGISQSAPATSTDCVQIIGWALSDSEIYFDFSRPYQLVE